MLVRNLLLAIGILSLLAGLALSVVWLSQTGSPTAERPELVRQSILVAARPVPGGTLLRPEDIGWKEVAAKDIRPGNLVRGQVSEAEFIGAVVRREFAAGEPLIVSEMVRPNERQFLAAAIKPGTRAVSIAVDAPQSAAGLILPGDQVDVILTQSFADTGTDPAMRSVAETVLRDVRVIAIDQTLTTPTRPASVARTLLPAESRVPKTVTFEVTEKQAERLIVAAQLGRLQLSVRPLEIGAAITGADKREAGPTWASDVSPALNELNRRKPQSGGTVESAVRRPPMTSVGP
jgi:pilus assembly protein CpaB